LKDDALRALHDIFFSYRRHELHRAAPLLEALEAAGLHVWRDQNDIPDFASVTERVFEGIAGSKAFLAFYSAKYPASAACQHELTAAWNSALLAGEEPASRVDCCLE